MKRTAIKHVEWKPVRGDAISIAIGGASYQSSTGCHALVTREPELHISVSHPSRYPTWDELASARDRFGGPDFRMVMRFPPRDEYVNLHNTCLHIWQDDGDG